MKIAEKIMDKLQVSESSTTRELVRKKRDEIAKLKAQAKALRDERTKAGKDDKFNFTLKIDKLVNAQYAIEREIEIIKEKNKK